METKKSTKHAKVLQLDTDTKTFVEALESPNLSSEDTVDNNANSGIATSATVVETNIEPEIYPIAKRFTKTELRRMNSLDYIEALEPPNLSSEDAVDNNASRGSGADIVETDIKYPIAKRLTKSELRRMNSLDYAGNKNVAEGLMDIALLSANANQLRFLLTYNNKAPTYYISLGLVSVSLVLQVVVGLALIFKRQLRKNDRRYIYIKELLIFGIFIITVVNVLIAAFTTTESDDKA